MLAAVKTAVATTAVAHAHLTPASQGKTLVMAQVMVQAMVARHAASAAHKAHAPHATTSHACRVMKCSARILAAPVLTWASSVTTSTNASRPAMCLPAFHHLACRLAALVAVAGVAIAVVAVVTLVAAVAEAIRVAGFGADPIAD